MMLSVLLILPLTLLVNGCPEMVWPECNWDEEISCWGGYDADGCEMPSVCVPNHNGINGTDGTKCWSNCPMMCDETEVFCPGELYNGCPMGDYCMPSDVGCPTVCPPTTDVQCGPDEFYCDMGYDNGCWMGSFCFTEECPAGTSPQQ